MSEPFLTVSLGEVRARGVHLETDEAAAIVLLLGERLGWRNPPPADVVLLTSDGRVDVRGADEAAARLPNVAGYALLLHELLPEPSAVRAVVPASLYGAIARALAHADTPNPADSTEFATELRRVLMMAPAEAVVAVMLRWADAAAAGRTEDRRERRSSGPNVSELRRQLRESDLQRFALLSQLTHMQPVPRERDDGVLRLAIPLPAWRTSPRIPSTVLERFRRPLYGTRRAPDRPVAAKATASPATTVTVRMTRTAAVACAAWLAGAGVDQTPPAGPHTRTVASVPVPAAVPVPEAAEPPAPPGTDGVVLVSTQPEHPTPAPRRTLKHHRAGKARRPAPEATREPEHQPNKFMRFVRRLFSA
jgi:hypothetical protein